MASASGGKRRGVPRVDRLAARLAYHLGHEPVPAAVLEDKRRTFGTGQVAVAPAHQSENDRIKLPAGRGQTVLEASRVLGVLPGVRGSRCRPGCEGERRGCRVAPRSAGPSRRTGGCRGTPPAPRGGPTSPPRSRACGLWNKPSTGHHSAAGACTPGIPGQGMPLCSAPLSSVAGASGNGCRSRACNV